jgi:hypothetical protein
MIFVKNTAFSALTKVVWVNNKYIHEAVLRATQNSFATEIWVATHRMRNTSVGNARLRNNSEAEQAQVPNL